MIDIHTVTTEFLKQIKETKEVYVLGEEMNILTILGSDEISYLPVWSDPDLAENYRKERKPNLTILTVTLHVFTYSWIKPNNGKYEEIGINHTTNGSQPYISVTELAENLNEK